MNSQAYVGGDPINFTDPSGMRRGRSRCTTYVSSGVDPKTGSSLYYRYTICRGGWTSSYGGFGSDGSIGGAQGGVAAGGIEGGNGTGCTTTAKGGKAIVAAAAAFAREQDFLSPDVPVVFEDSFALDVAGIAMPGLQKQPKGKVIFGRTLGGVITLFRPATIARSFDKPIVSEGTYLSAYEVAIFTIGHEAFHINNKSAHRIDDDPTKQNPENENGEKLLKLCRSGGRK